MAERIVGGGLRSERDGMLQTGKVQYPGST
jgi:hypothetical protein